MAFAAGAEIVLSLLQRNAYASKLGQGSSPAPPRTEIWYHCQRSNPVGTTQTATLGHDFWETQGRSRVRHSYSEGAVRLNHPRQDLVRSIGVCLASPPTP